MSFCIQRKKDALESPDICVKNVVKPEPKRRRRSKEPTASSSYPLVNAEKQPQAAELVHESEPPDNPPAEQVGEGAGASEECASCVLLRNEKRKLSNTVKSLREKLIEKRKELTKIEKKVEGKSFSEAGYVIYLYEKYNIFPANSTWPPNYSRETRSGKYASAVFMLGALPALH